MIEDIKPYPAYRDSGVPWLGEVPEHWVVRRCKYLLRERDVRSVDGTEQLLRVSQYTGVTKRRRTDGLDEPDTRAESLVGYGCNQSSARGLKSAGCNPLPDALWQEAGK